MTKWTLADISSLHSRLAVVTGAHSGIGWHTALELARAGSEVILASRTEAKGCDAVDRIRQEVPQAKVRAEVLDLASLRSMQSFAAKIDSEKIMEAFMSHDAAHGAMPTLRAATAIDAISGSYFAPERMFQLKGVPVPVPIP